QKQFSNLIDNVPAMVNVVQDLISYWQANQTVIPEEVNQAIDKFTQNLQSYLENIMSYLFGFISQLISFIASIILIPFFLFFMLKDGEKLEIGSASCREGAKLRRGVVCGERNCRLLRESR